MSAARTQMARSRSDSSGQADSSPMPILVGSSFSGMDMTRAYSELRVSEGRAAFDATRPIRIDSLRSSSKSGGQSPPSSSPSFSSLAPSLLACASDGPFTCLAIVAAGYHGGDSRKRPGALDQFTASLVDVLSEEALTELTEVSVRSVVERPEHLLALLDRECVVVCDGVEGAFDADGRAFVAVLTQLCGESEDGSVGQFDPGDSHGAIRQDAWPLKVCTTRVSARKGSREHPA